MSDDILTDEQIGFCYDLGKMWKIKASHIAANAEIARLRDEQDACAKTMLQDSKEIARLRAELEQVCGAEPGDRRHKSVIAMLSSSLKKAAEELAEKERVIRQRFAEDIIQTFGYDVCDDSIGTELASQIRALASGGEQGQGGRVAGKCGKSNETGSGASDSGATSKPPAAPSPAAPVCRCAVPDKQWNAFVLMCLNCGKPIVTDREEGTE